MALPILLFFGVIFPVVSNDAETRLTDKNYWLI
jgi:hypothetical protein